MPTRQIRPRLLQQSPVQPPHQMRVRHVAAQVLRGLRIDLQRGNCHRPSNSLCSIRAALFGSIAILRGLLLLLLVNLLLLAGFSRLCFLLPALLRCRSASHIGFRIDFLSNFSCGLEASWGRGVAMILRKASLSMLLFLGWAAACCRPQACPRRSLRYFVGAAAAATLSGVQCRPLRRARGVSLRLCGIWRTLCAGEACGRAQQHRYGPPKPAVRLASVLHR